MQENTSYTPAKRRRSGGRIASIVAGGVAAVLAIGFIAGGALLLWGDSKKDDQGYLSTGKDRYAASTYALATDNLDVDLGGAGWIMDRDDLGNVRLAVESSVGKPVFVEIAHTSDVTHYLQDTSYTSVTDVDYSPFHASYRDHGGDRRPARPADQDFWAASAHGSGTQTVAWDLEDGDWSIVVMNADGSRGVDTDISAEAKVPFLGTLGWVSLGGALVLLITAGPLLYLGLRTPRPPKAQTVTLQPSPGAAASSEDTPQTSPGRAGLRAGRPGDHAGAAKMSRRGSAAASGPISSLSVEHGLWRILFGSNHIASAEHNANVRFEWNRADRTTTKRPVSRDGHLVKSSMSAWRSRSASCGIGSAGCRRRSRRRASGAASGWRRPTTRRRSKATPSSFGR